MNQHFNVSSGLRRGCLSQRKLTVDELPRKC